MKKKIISILLILALVASAMCLSGCSEKTSVVSAKPEDFYTERDFVIFADIPCTYYDEKEIQDYAALGFNVYALNEEYINNGSRGAITEDGGGVSDNYKKAVTMLKESGLNVFIRNQYNDPDYLTNTDEDYDKIRKIYGEEYTLPWRDITDDFDEFENVTGFYMFDEPAAYSGREGFHGIAEYEKMVDWYNEYGDGRYFHVNLFPLYTGQEHFNHPTDSSLNMSYDQYIDYYVEHFITNINGPKSLCIDNYPFQIAGEIRQNYYQNLLIIANKVKEYNDSLGQNGYPVDMGLCIQSFRDINGIEDIKCAGDISFQLCMGMAMGARMYQYYLYSTLSDGQYGIVSANGQHRIYDYVKEANDNYLPFQNILTGFEWQGVTTVLSKNEDDSENKTGFSDLGDLVLPMSQMGELEDISSRLDSLVGYFVKDEYSGYMVVNCTLPSTGKVSSVTLDFGEHEKAIVYTEKAEGQIVDTVGGELRITIPAGGGVFVIPI